MFAYYNTLQVVRSEVAIVFGHPCQRQLEIRLSVLVYCCASTCLDPNRSSFREERQSYEFTITPNVFFSQESRAKIAVIGVYLKPDGSLGGCGLDELLENNLSP